MPVTRISPEEALDLMEREGYVYVDVRSIQEFDAGHPRGACNVPLLELGPGGPTPNPDFLAVMEQAFGKEAKILVGCQSGGRSLQAASLLERAGFVNLREQRAGFQGAPGPQGRMEPGWKPKGLPTETEAPPERTYAVLKGRS
jgi:rhodanese-related sulfurtransferase